MTLPQTPDAELVVLVKLKNAQGKLAYGVLVDRHQPWVFRLLKNLLQTPDAEEVKQETFITAWLDIAKLLFNERFRGWVRGIAVRGAYRRYRRAELEKRNEGQVDLNPISSPLEDSLESDNAVRVVLERMDYVYREVLVLRYVEELSVSEIAETLGLGESATKMRLLRARELFKVHYVEVTRG